MPVEILLASLIGSILSLDISLVSNFMISRPIVAGPLLGYILGDLRLGIELGFLFECLWADVIYVGTAVPFNVTLFISLILGVSAVLPYYGSGIVMFVILACIPMALIFRQIEIYLRAINSNFADQLDESLSDGKISTVYFTMMKGMAVFILVNFILLFVSIVLISGLIKSMFFRLSPEILYALKYTYNVLPIVGFAVLLNIFMNSSWRDIFRKIFKKGQRNAV